MALIGEHIPNYVQKQIQIRQKTHGSGVLSERTDDQLLALNSKTAFIKLASGVWMGEEKLRELGGDEFAKKYIGKNLAKEHVLFGGYARMGINSSDKEGILYQRTGFLGDDGAYEATKDWGIVPMPGIDSMEVKSMNRGSLKKATIRLTAQNRDQLNILDVLYLRLGYTVLLEWGNTLYIDNDGNIKKSYTSIIENNDGFFSDSFNINKNGIGQTSFKPILDKISKAREAHDGNFDALLGKISNFNWSFNPDGSYSIEITLISLGDVVESLKTNVPAVNKTLEYVNDTGLGWIAENDSLDQHRKDNIILSLLHVFRLQNLTPKGKDIYITTTGNDPAKLGKLLDGGDAELTASKFSLTLTAKYYFYNKATEKNITGSKDLKFSDSGIYDSGQTFTTPTDGTIELVPTTLPSGDIIAKIKTKAGKTVKPSRVLVFMNEPSKTFEETKPFSEVEISEWEKDKTNTASPITTWINDWKSKYVFTESEFNTKKNGWAPSDLVPTYFKDLAKIKEIDYLDGGTNKKLYNFAINITPDPVKKTVSKISVPNPLNGTGYKEDDAFLLNMNPKQYYIRFGYLLELLKNKVVTRIDIGDNVRSKNPNIFDIDTSNAPMLCLPLQISFDWRTCIVARKDFNRPGAFNQDIFPELQKWVINGNTANAMNIYLNFNFIADSMVSNTDAKGNVSVYDFIKAMCDGINKALAGVNNLEPIIDEEDNTLRIFDSTSRPKESSKTDPDYLLQLYGYGDGSTAPSNVSTFVRKVDLKTAITPEYATMITVGAAAGGYVKGTEATAFARWNDGIKDRFKTRLISADPQVDKSSDPKDNDDDPRISFFTTNRWSAKCFGIEPSSGDQSAYLWGMFPK